MEVVELEAAKSPLFSYNFQNFAYSAAVICCPVNNSICRLPLLLTLSSQYILFIIVP